MYVGCQPIKTLPLVIRKLPVA
uniref:Uncharacterized protein n=1 Tax=Anguilla anguilla TaxID=7936 RepID=A0A0E9TD26_ANGAN